MDHRPDGTLRYSPHDLVAYLEGDFAAWCERLLAERARSGAAGPAELEWATPDEGDPEIELAVRKGQEHELRYLQRLREEYPTIVEIDRADPEAEARTLAAMGAGAPLIYQGHLVSDGWHGYPDFLFRCGNGNGNGAACACPSWRYTPWDTKLARSAKPHFLIQLCAYADMLEATRGFRPDEVVFVLGQGEKRPYRTGHFFYYYRHLRRSFAAFQSRWDLARVPDPGLDRSWGRWEKAAEKLLESSDHLSRVATITRRQVRRLEEGGIETLTALVGCEPGRGVPKLSEQVFERLRVQARLQLESQGRTLPCWQHRPPVSQEQPRGLAQLPPKSDGDVFFDMEGFPYADNGLEYLFGAVTVDDVAPVFHEWWAHDAREEQAAFEGFIDWLVARRRQDPSLHVYHYAAYEESAVKRLMGKYATREAEVDDLLRGGVFVDLYRVVQQGFVIGTRSYSLKDIERLYLPLRTGAVLSAGGSVVEYQRWIDGGEPRSWEASPILQGIREYNRVDCESLWGLRSWLLDRQRESGIAYIPHPERSEGPAQTAPETRRPGPSVAPLPRDEVVVRLLERAKSSTDPEHARLDQLIAWLVDFHRREEKPMWWRRFDRHEMTIEERFDDRDCLAALTRTETPARRIQRSLGLEYRFDPRQETTLGVGDNCIVAGTELRAKIVRLDEDEGLVEVKAAKPLPGCTCLIPDEYVSAETIKQAIARYAEAWERGEIASQAVDDLLRRRSPRITGHPGGALVGATEDLVERVCDLAAHLDRSTLCIQGPPGTGKTYTAAAMIVELFRRGSRVGVTAQSHKVIMNAMRAVAKALDRCGISAALCKVGEHDDDPLVEQGIVREIENDDVPAVLDAGACLVGGTAWLFSRAELTGRFDYVVIDEAGQVSLANAVAVGLSARNLILVGDQMQLSQVTQGHHPSDTGLSCLQYLLQGNATVPEDSGVFLGSSRRMHPNVCRFVSDAVYDGRLGSIPETAHHRVIRNPADTLVPAETGIVWYPVEHDGCTQSSDEECDAIVSLVDELLRRRVADRTGVERPMTPGDILIVTPFNLQVRCLRPRLDPGIRIGSVDRFQGQEAPVVIVSLCASTLEEAPRGASFLLNPNRLNVAVSRAEALAIVVGCPDLMEVRCRSVEEMRLVNLLCHLVQYAEASAG